MITTRSESFALSLEKKKALFPCLLMSQHHESKKKNKFIKQERQGMMGQKQKLAAPRREKTWRPPGRKHGH